MQNIDINLFENLILQLIPTPPKSPSNIKWHLCVSTSKTHRIKRQMFWSSLAVFANFLQYMTAWAARLWGGLFPKIHIDFFLDPVFVVRSVRLCFGLISVWTQNLNVICMWQVTTKGTLCLLLTILRFAACEISISFPMTPTFWKLNFNFWRYEKRMVSISYYFIHILQAILLNISKSAWPT